MKHISEPSELAEHILSPISREQYLPSVEKSSNSILVSLISDAAGFAALENDWRDLEKQNPNTLLFQSYDWCYNHMRFSKNNSGFKPRIIAIRRNMKLVALLPLVLKDQGRLSVLTGFSEPFQQYTEILVKPRTDLDILRQPVRAAMKRSGADYFHFGQVREDGNLANLLKGIAPPSGERDGAPFVVITDFPDHETYFATINAKTRKNMRNLRNRLERDAPLTHHVIRGGQEMADLVQRAYEGREAWLERMGITSRAFRDDEFLDFLQRFATDGKAEGVETIAMSLRHGDKPVSDQWGFVYRGRYYAFMATWNPEYEPFSPGRLHLDQVIRTCFDEGLEIADFMIPAASYKLTWTQNIAMVRDHVLPLTMRGRAYTSLWLGFARPLSKRLVFAMPPTLRSFLVKKLLPVVE
jgi:CelD/BcsL family acetyltransferase involved in cellulose biosynthesis